MIKVCLDLETYRADKDDVFKNEKIIAVGMLMDFKSSSSTSIDNEIAEYKFRDPIPSQGTHKRN